MVYSIQFNLLCKVSEFLVLDCLQIYVCVCATYMTSNMHPTHSLQRFI